jgi:biopolymer transport protein ExbD
MKHYQNKTNVIGAISDINTTPLVDVMLVLLIIFMISAPMPQNFSHAKIPLTGGGGEKPPTLLTLDIAPAGNGALLMLDGKPITLSGLSSAIKTGNAAAPLALNLRTDPATSYAAVAKVLATIQLSGAKNVRFDELAQR